MCRYQDLPRKKVGLCFFWRAERPPEAVFPPGAILGSQYSGFRTFCVVTDLQVLGRDTRSVVLYSTGSDIALLVCVKARRTVVATVLPLTKTPQKLV